MLYTNLHSYQRLPVLFVTIIFFLTLTSVRIVFSQTEVAGEVSGVWNTEGSPYILIDDIDIEDDDSLLIEPGVEIRYDGRFYIHVNGYLEAVGNEEDSILFVPNGEDEDAGGLGIRFIGPTPNCELCYFRISGMRGDARNINSGAAVYIRNRGEVSLRNGVISDNQCDNDAAIELANSSECHIENLLIEGNSSPLQRLNPGMRKGAGIAVWTDATAVIENCIFRNNNAGTGYGGGISSNSTSDELVIRGNVFERNQAYMGGGVYLIQSAALVADNLFLENRTPGGYGGGLAIHNSRREPRGVIVVNNRFIGNQAAHSAGASISLGRRNRSYLLENEFIDNEAEISRGAIGGGYVVFSNGLIYGNRAPFGSAISAVEVHLINSVVWANESDEGEPIIAAEYLTMSYCDIQDIEEGNGILSRDPLFNDPEVFDFTLNDDSPLIDAGHPHSLFNDDDGSRCDIGSLGGSGFAAGPIIWNFGDVWHPFNYSVDLTVLWTGENRLNLTAPSFETGENFHCRQEEAFSIEPWSYFRLGVVFEPSGRGEFTDRLFIRRDGVGEDAQVLMEVQGECTANVITGNISGVLTAEHSPYQVIDHAVIPEGETLEIEAGVQIEFCDNYVITTRGGSLIIRGTRDQPVVITSTDDSLRGYIDIIEPQEPVRIEHLHLQHNRGISVYSGEVNLFSSRFTSNGIGDRPAVGVQYGVLTAQDCIFEDNGHRPEWPSGAIHVSYGELRVEDCTFIGNGATFGAGIHASRTESCMVMNCTFERNDSHRGGAMLVYHSVHLVLLNNTFIENRSVRHGGGASFFIDWPDDVEARAEDLLVLHNNQWLGNQTEGTGGGIYLEISGSTFQSNIFHGDQFIGNRASMGGGAYLAGYNGEITNTLFHSNIADTGGGVYVESHKLHLLNSILWANQADEDAHIHPNQHTEIEYSCIEGGFEGEGNIDENPLFINVEEGDFQLGEDSPCVDAGIDNVFDRDLDGTRNDMGSYGGGRVLLSTHQVWLPATWIERRRTCHFKLFNPREEEFHIEEITLTQEHVFSLEAEVPAVFGSGESYIMALTFEPEEEGEFTTEISVFSEDFPEDEPGILLGHASATEATNYITLNRGWNMISINLDPQDDRIMTIFTDVVDRERLILVKDGSGRFYAPEWDYDNIRNWQRGSGYQVKVREEDELTIVGDIIPFDTPIPLSRGWNVIAYYPEEAMEAPWAFESIEGVLLIAKDEYGHFYAPGWVWMWFTCFPTRGYQVLVEEDVDLIYPEEPEQRVAIAESDLTQPTDGHWTTPVPTGQNMSVLVTSLNDVHVAERDQIAAFSQDGRMVGVGTVDMNGHCGIAVWGDDPTTEAVDGALEGEALRFRLWDGSVERVIVPEVMDGDLVYHTDGFSALRLESEPSVPVEFGISAVYPNPFNSSTRLTYGLPEAARVELIVYDLTGRVVAELIDGRKASGMHTLMWDASKQPSGVYLARLITPIGVRTVKMTLVR